ncbi:MAG: hypothetical protein L3J14_01690 [Flavobacteriaceae bacterium]|nr:hypothetical protein [Flavobacteriaceae bacterium]
MAQETNPIKTKLFFTDASKKVEITEKRKGLLISIAEFIASEIKKSNSVNLNFICTHNSRRSQLAQVWAHYAINCYNLKNIKSFSGGTEATAFHRNTVKTLQEVGFEFKLTKISHTNPVYEISFENMKQPIIGFSKIYDDISIKKPFIAITTCSSANENCPFISDALQRFHLEYEDPKSSDNTGFTSEKYLKTNQIIAAEINFLFQYISKMI